MMHHLSGETPTWPWSAEEDKPKWSMEDGGSSQLYRDWLVENEQDPTPDRAVEFRILGGTRMAVTVAIVVAVMIAVVTKIAMAY